MSVIGKHLAYKIGIWNRAKMVRVRQEKESFLVGNFLVNTFFKVRDSILVLDKVTMDV